MIKTWQQRCDEHPDHQQGIVTQQMIQDRMQEEIDELRQSLAQPEQEPVAWVYNGILHEFDPSEFATNEVKPLYTAPPCQTGSQCIGGKCPECGREWVGLTDDEFYEATKIPRNSALPMHMLKAIEAKLKEKNT